MSLGAGRLITMAAGLFMAAVGRWWPGPVGAYPAITRCGRRPMFPSSGSEAAAGALASDSDLAAGAASAGCPWDLASNTASLLCSSTRLVCAYCSRAVSRVARAAGLIMAAGDRAGQSPAVFGDFWRQAARLASPPPYPDPPAGAEQVRHLTVAAGRAAAVMRRYVGDIAAAGTGVRDGSWADAIARARTATTLIHRRVAPGDRPGAGVPGRVARRPPGRLRNRADLRAGPAAHPSGHHSSTATGGPCRTGRR